MTTYTQKELEIANKSYTNKDFESIYLELLELAEKISKRFSPTDANEADPFIVLLKLIASVSDKINYNVDKNILERFLLSCTQESSMRELTDMLGYSMKYHRSAETSVIFKYDFTDPDIHTVTIPAFSILTDGGDIQYVTTENARINEDEKVSNAVHAIQGKLKELMVLGKSTIQLENLDINRRLYLPEVMIAENGISITSIENKNAWQSWTASTNLNVEIYGSLVYKFGFDSVKNLPYLEFPEWVSDVIGNGLAIKYIITDGSAGNLSARSLTTVSRLNATDGIKDEDITVINLSSATSGAEAESMSEAYSGCKRLIGTFDNLVTCRDYANKIYEELNAYGNPCVSNVQISDRRTDINYGCQLVSASNSGVETYSYISPHYDQIVTSCTLSDQSKLTESDVGKIFYLNDSNRYVKCHKVVTENIDAAGNSQKITTYEFTDGLSESELNHLYYVIELDKYVKYRKFEDGSMNMLSLTFDELKDEITPYDLCIYPLNPILNTSCLAVNDANGYNNSYNILTNTSQLSYIKSSLEDYKTLSHTYKQLKESDIGYIQTSTKLEATINTVKKVSAIEQTEILLNVNNALIAKYNPRTLRFGQDIAFDELLATIENADRRIKSVSLQEPEQTPKIILMNNDMVDLYDADGKASNEFKFIVSKNILAGRVEAFEYDKDFTYTFFQNGARKVDDVVNVTTACNINSFPVSSQPTVYTLNSNEVIQFLAPNLITDVTYPYGINYYLEFNGDEKTFIAKNSEYKLQNGDLIVFTYVNNNDETVIKVYDGSDEEGIHIIKPNFDLYSSKYRADPELNKETPTKIGVKNDDYPTQYNTEKHKFYTLSANQTVEHRTLSWEHIDVFKRCYWLTNQANNEILWDHEVIMDGDTFIGTYYSYILGDGEYFFYADAGLTTLRAFGAGTRLRITSSKENPLDMRSAEWRHSNYINVEDIDANGLDALGDYFIGKSFSDDLYLDIFENELLTLTSGDRIEVKNSSASNFEIPNNTFTSVPANIAIRYQFEDDIINGNTAYNTLPDRGTLAAESVDAGWMVRSVLDLNAGPNKPQQLVGNQTIDLMPGVYDASLNRYVGYDDLGVATLNQLKITLKAKDPENPNPNFKSTFISTYPIVRSGGSKINLQYLDLDLSYKCPSMLYFDIENINELQSLGSGFYIPVFESIKGKASENVYTGSVTCKLNTSPVDFMNISSDSLGADIWAEAGSYFNNTLYYHTAEKAYYTPVRIGTGHYEWKKVEKVLPNHRMFMIYIEGLSGSVVPTVNATAGKIKLYNKASEWASDGVITLTNGINIIEIADEITDQNPKVPSLCENINLKLEVSAATEDAALQNVQNVACLISPLKIVCGLNPLLGLSEDDNLIDYMKVYFNKQFKEFFICADLETSKEIDITYDYRLNSAQAFYDPNNIANAWTLPKIDFPSSNIKISRNSKM